MQIKLKNNYYFNLYSWTEKKLVQMNLDPAFPLTMELLMIGFPLGARGNDKQFFLLISSISYLGIGYSVIFPQ